MRSRTRGTKVAVALAGVAIGALAVGCGGGGSDPAAEREAYNEAVRENLQLNKACRNDVYRERNPEKCEGRPTENTTIPPKRERVTTPASSEEGSLQAFPIGKAELEDEIEDKYARLAESSNGDIAGLGGAGLFVDPLSFQADCFPDRREPGGSVWTCGVKFMAAQVGGSGFSRQVAVRRVEVDSDGDWNDTEFVG